MNTPAFDGTERPTYPERVPSKPWQIMCREKMRGKKHFAIFMEQGLGKTKNAIDHGFALWQQGAITGVLVLSLKGVHRQWVRSQLAEHAPDEYAAFEWPFRQLPEGAAPGNTLRWLAMNIDAISASANGFAVASAFIKAHKGRVLLIVDESHTIKNFHSRRSKAARRLGAMVSNRLIMTGTPLGKNIEEEFVQFLFLDPTIIGISHLTVFRREYCIMGGFENREIIGHRNLDRWKRLIEPYLFHYTKDQAGIEAKMVEPWIFDMTNEQIRIIRQLKQGLLSEIKAGVVSSAATAAVAVMRICQVASGFVTDSNNQLQRLFDDPEKNPRVIALREIIESHDGKMVIWARFVEDIDLLMSLLGTEAVRYDGSTSDKQRSVAIDKFLHDPATRFFVSNPQAGGTGLNLQGSCNMAVYFSHSNGAILRSQSEDRIHRLGTVGVVQYINMIARHSFDKRIIKSQRDGVDLLRMTMPDIVNMLTEDD
jgi:SNF2 family DNA or RNA helicase